MANLCFSCAANLICLRFPLIKTFFLQNRNYFWQNNDRKACVQKSTEVSQIKSGKSFAPNFNQNLKAALL